MENCRASRRFLGITILGDFILSEGVDAVLENVHRVGATAVACNPTVTAPSAKGTGSFQPPTDAGASPRRFDRPLWGRHSLWVHSGPSFSPKAEFYRNCPYGPRRVNGLTEKYGDLIERFINAAVNSGLKVYLQLGAAQPTGLLDDDRPKLPNGQLPKNRMADTGSLASEAIRAYNRAYIQDLLTAYPQITGLRPDWPESPCYTLGEVFQDFSPHVQSWARRHGFDFDGIRRDVATLYDALHGRLSRDDLHQFADFDRGVFSSLNGLRRLPGVAEWFRLKAALSVDLLRDWREAIDEAGGTDKELAPNAFMPPWTVLTGFDFAGAAAFCHSIAPKLYTMHWSLMVRFWGEELLAANPDLQESVVVRALVNLMDLADAPQTHETLAEYGYPQPDEPHPIADEPQRRKIASAKYAARAGGDALVFPLVHGYGPLDDFCRRLRLVAESDADGVWLNRYGYLGDDKLDGIASIWKS